ncbi:PTS sugar transporter subunit IIA [Lonepinella koalarum]|uniref:PTS sugar transporter subunit IIA n=1 Tax=Lonepinella koalarum TaxID=53417 RepID=UPI003F6E1B23
MSSISIDHVFLDLHFDKAEEAISFIGDTLITHHLAKPSYKEAMLNMFAKFGGIIVLDDGIAMPHARPEEGALMDSIIFVQLKDPIDFHNEDFSPVSHILGLCSTGSSQHIKMIQLIGLLIENGFAQRTFKTAEEVNDFVNFVKQQEELQC